MIHLRVADTAESQNQESWERKGNLAMLRPLFLVGFAAGSAGDLACSLTLSFNFPGTIKHTHLLL